jgi:CHAT domain-containing protein
MSDRGQRLQNKSLGAILALGLLPIMLRAAVINVPRDFVSIRSAVAAARDGDIVEVEDGIYFEENIVIDKALHIRSKNPYGAVIQGSYQKNTDFAIFFVKAAAEIEGFILKNSFDGIVQRHSPDVQWSAHDLIILNMDYSAITINAVSGHVGRARVFNIIVDNAAIAFSTNDANSLEVKDCYIFNCQEAFSGSNHLSFVVDDTSIWNCASVMISEHNLLVLSPPATEKVIFGPHFKILEAKAFRLTAGQSPDQVLPGLAGRPAAVKAHVLGAIADGFLQTGNLPQAETFYRGAIQQGHRLRSSEILLRSHYGLGLVQENQGRLGESLDSFRQAIQSIARLVGPIPKTVFYSAFLKDKLEVIGSALRVLDRMQPGAIGDGPAVEAFDIIEQARARGILDSLQESIGAGSRAAGAPDIAAEEKKLSREISKIQIELKNANLSEYRKRELGESLEKSEQAYLDYLSRRGRPSGKNRSSPATPLPYGAIRDKLLKDRTALIEYYFAGNAGFGILATSQGVFLAKLPGPGLIAEKIQYYLWFLTLRDGGEFKSRAGGRILSDMLLKPFLDRIPPDTKRLIIIPGGPLWSLPFEALLLPSGETSSKTAAPRAPGRFLIERFEVIYAPSASCLAFAVGRDMRPRKKDWLGLARSKDFPVPIMTLGAGARPSDLHWVNHEIKSISANFAAERSSILLHGASQEKTFKETNLEQYRIIHLATHGIIDDINWRRSALLLGADDRAAEDGLLQPREIAALRLNADLVVLSACHSATGSYETGEGLKGLSLAFFTAGAKSVLASLWTVSDSSTPYFMKCFYQHLMEGASKGRALQLAKLDMLRSEYRHPFFWAAFILIGDWSRAVR